MSAYSEHLGRFLALSLSLLLLNSYILVQAGEKRVKLRKVEKIREDDKHFESSVQLGKPDAEGHILVSGKLKPHVTLDNDWKVNITAYRTDNLDKEYTVFQDPPAIAFCDMMSSYYKNFFYEKLKDYSNAPSPDNCPLAPQEFHLKDYPLNSSQLKNLLSPGYYRVIGQLLKDNETKLEYLIEFQVE